MDVLRSSSPRGHHRRAVGMALLQSIHFHSTCKVTTIAALASMERTCTEATGYVVGSPKFDRFLKEIIMCSMRLVLKASAARWSCVSMMYVESHVLSF